MCEAERGKLKTQWGLQEIRDDTNMEWQLRQAARNKQRHCKRVALKTANGKVVEAVQALGSSYHTSHASDVGHGAPGLSDCHGKHQSCFGPSRVLLFPFRMGTCAPWHCI